MLDDATLKALSTTEGGADVLPTTRTVPHWFGSTTDPHNSVTYGYNMAGADPNHCSGSACDVTIEGPGWKVFIHSIGSKFTLFLVCDGDVEPSFVKREVERHAPELRRALNAMA